MVTRLTRVSREIELEGSKVKSSFMTGVQLRAKLRVVQEGLRKMGTMEMVTITEFVKPEPRSIRYICSRVIYYYEYLANFKRIVAPNLVNIVRHL